MVAGFDYLPFGATEDGRSNPEHDISEMILGAAQSCHLSRRRSQTGRTDALPGIKHLTVNEQCRRTRHRTGARERYRTANTGGASDTERDELAVRHKLAADVGGDDGHPSRNSNACGFGSINRQTNLVILQ